MAFKTALEAAIASLIARGVIKGSSDVARDLDLKSRGTVSSYVTGKAQLSDGFRTKFESRYGIRIADFEGSNGEAPAAKVQHIDSQGFDTNLTESIRMMAESKLIDSRSIERLITILEKSLGLKPGEWLKTAGGANVFETGRRTTEKKEGQL